MQQLPLFPLPDLTPTNPPTDLSPVSFSHDRVWEEGARQTLEARHAGLLEETSTFNRQLVSFQANKQATLHRWLPYREGFSASLVEKLLHQFGLQAGDALLDPFAGSATTLLVAQAHGLDAVGIELLPICHLAWQAKATVGEYDLRELRELRRLVVTTPPPAPASPFPHLTITEGAFSEEAERDLMGYSAWLETLPTEQTRTLCRLLLASILEEVSYTRKDGQYLRWDGRAPKVVERNAIRVTQGKEPFRTMNKGTLPTVQEAFGQALASAIRDIAMLQQRSLPAGNQRLLHGSALELLPTLPADQMAAVITSPPYCNRYDYTRTYALELAYLGVGEDIFRLRQAQLSCTVENRSKQAPLAAHYEALGLHERYRSILDTVQRHPVFVEVNAAMQERLRRGDLNNKGVVTMVEGYFTELAFILAELYRVVRRGGWVAIVNDNVRYGGEIIPVDLLSTDLAIAFGFEPIKVYVLPQRKGNSSQQMKKFGRVPLRKSITLWRKP